MVGVDIRGIKLGIRPGFCLFEKQMEEVGKGKGRQGESWYARNLQPIGIITTKSTQMIPNPLKLWTMVQHS